jgi:hypothetical protein
MMSRNTKLGSVNNPVKCKDIEGEHQYFEMLCSPEGKAIQYQRKGSLFGDSGTILDLYEVNYEGLSEPIHVYMDMYAKGPKDKKAVEGLSLINSFLKAKEWQSPDYLSLVLDQFFPLSKPEIKDHFIHIYFKAGALLAMGTYIYGKKDYFGFPMQDWDLFSITKTAEQMVHQARGIDPGHPILIKDEAAAIEFLKTFHYDTFGIEIFDGNTTLFHARHVFSEDDLYLYFELSKM